MKAILAQIQTGRPGQAIPCTACGRPLYALVAVKTGRGEAILCCKGCGRRGVFCDCRIVDNGLAVGTISTQPS